jgi:hypothetical protein
MSRLIVVWLRGRLGCDNGAVARLYPAPVEPEVNLRSRDNMECFRSPYDLIHAEIDFRVDEVLLRVSRKDVEVFESCYDPAPAVHLRELGIICETRPGRIYHPKATLVEVIDRLQARSPIRIPFLSLVGGDGIRLRSRVDCRELPAICSVAPTRTGMIG